MATKTGFVFYKFLAGFVVGVISGVATYYFSLFRISYLSPPLIPVIALLLLLAAAYFATRKKKSGLDNVLAGFFAGIFLDLLLLLAVMAYLGVP